IPLWPETTAALREWLTMRPAPAKDEYNDLVFLTVKGGSWSKATSDNPISKETAKVMKAAKRNSHRGVYCLRHSFQTVADRCQDFIAVRMIMGHASNDIADHYRERISDDRLQAVVDHVRTWLFGSAAADGEQPDVVKFPQAKIG